MIEASYEIIDEVHILGGTAALLKVRLWEPNQLEPEFKFKIVVADHNGEFLTEWPFPSETEATEAFFDLGQNAA